MIRSGEVVVDDASYTAKLGGRSLDLTFKEFELLKYLAQHPGRVFSRQQLLQEVWGYDYFGGTRTVDVHVRRLRAKLGPENETLIGTVRNVGYRFVIPAVEKAAERRPGTATPRTPDGRSSRLAARRVGRMDDAPLATLRAITDAAAEADGAQPLDEGAWRRLSQPRATSSSSDVEPRHRDDRARRRAPAPRRRPGPSRVPASARALLRAPWRPARPRVAGLVARRPSRRGPRSQPASASTGSGSCG